MSSAANNQWSGKVVSDLRATVVSARNVDELVSYSGSSREHGESQVAQIAASILEFGFTNPVLIDEHDTIIAGEGRVLAAKRVGLSAVPCIVLAGLNESQKAAYVIADNKLALNAEWDDEKLVAELGRLSELDYDLALTGFSGDEIAALLEGLDEVVETPETGPSNTLLGFTLPDTDDTGQGPPSTPSTAPAAPAPPAAITRTPTAPNAAPDRTNPRDEWTGMPEFNQANAGPYRTVYIHFLDQAGVDAFTKLTGLPITDKTKSAWYPLAPTTTGDVIYG
jgi:hypothetical protein